MGRPAVVRKGRSLDQKTPEKIPIGGERSGVAVKRTHDCVMRTCLALQVANLTQSPCKFKSGEGNLLDAGRQRTAIRNEPLRCANVLDKCSGMRVLSGYLYGITGPVVTD